MRGEGFCLLSPTPCYILPQGDEASARDSAIKLERSFLKPRTRFDDSVADDENAMVSATVEPQPQKEARRSLTGAPLKRLVLPPPSIDCLSGRNCQSSAHLVLDFLRFRFSSVLPYTAVFPPFTTPRTPPRPMLQEPEYPEEEEEVDDDLKDAEDLRAKRQAEFQRVRRFTQARPGGLPSPLVKGLAVQAARAVWIVGESRS